jgi:hypothetical protein
LLIVIELGERKSNKSCLIFLSTFISYTLYQFLSLSIYLLLSLFVDLFPHLGTQFSHFHGRLNKKVEKTFYWRKSWMSFFLTNTRWHKMIPRKRKKNRYSISTKRFLQIIYRSWKKSSLFTFSINCKFNCIQCIFAQLDSTILWSSNGPLH